MPNNKGKGCDNSAHLFSDSYFFFSARLLFLLYLFICLLKLSFKGFNRNKHAVLLISFVPSGIYTGVYAFSVFNLYFTAALKSLFTKGKKKHSLKL